jgi:antitoxin component of MazEF toxin-antitoxin module
MPSVRKIYKQGTTPVISLPPNVLRLVGAGIGSQLIIYPITDVSLIAEVYNLGPTGQLDLDRVARMRAVIVRSVYRQGNSFVCSISTFMLERIGISVGDYLSIQPISENAFTLTARSAAQVSFDQAQGRTSYRKAERANPG